MDKDNLGEYLAECADRQKVAQESLLRLLGPCTLDPLIKRKRLDLIRARAERHFYDETRFNYTALTLSVPCAVKEWPDDLVGHLCHLVDTDEDPAGDIMPDGEPRKCATCHQVLPGTAFYDYGSASCRDCNVDGLRISDDWEKPGG